LVTLCVLLCAAAQAAEPEVVPLTLAANGRTSSALWMHPAQARALLVQGHGAQDNLESPFLAKLSEALAKRGVATLRFNFPYAEAGASQPDPPPILQATLRAAVAEGAKRRGEIPLLLGGKSLSTLVVSRVLAGGLEPVSGAVMLSFPLHQPSRPSARNAGRLERVPVPMLFVQGTHDPLADIALMRGLVEQLGARARLHEVEGADHQFRLPATSARRPEDVADEIAGAIAAFAATLAPTSGG
jgi:hypothetical protein